MIADAKQTTPLNEEEADTLAVSLINQADAQAQATGHGGFIEREVISGLVADPTDVKAAINNWIKANPGLAITFNSQPVNWS